MLKDAAVIEAAGSGFFKNDGYKFKGKDISDNDAIVQVRYNQRFNSRCL